MPAARSEGRLAAARRLREASGAGIRECMSAIDRCDGDVLLAQGWLKYHGCAVNVRPAPGQDPHDAYEAWVWQRAREWVASIKAEIANNENSS